MSKYQSGDIVTYYFVIKRDEFGKKIIQGWTDNKQLAKFYMDFHKCKHFTLKSITDKIENISNIINENIHDEIMVYNIITKNRRKNSSDDIQMIMIPLTKTEKRFIDEEVSSFMVTSIDYGLINDAMPYLKSKYQSILQSIFLPDIIRKVVYSQNTKFSQMIQFDELLVLYRYFPENFGE